MPAGGAPGGPGADGAAAGGGLAGAWGDEEDVAGEELTAAEIRALEEANGVWDDPAWLEELYAQEVSPEEAGDAGEPGCAEILDAGFTHGEPGGSGRGFGSGGVLDRMLPGRDLAAVTGHGPGRRPGPAL